MDHSEFVVSRYENRNGVTSWRVAGWLHGVRIRKNLKTREEAAVEKAELELKSLQAASGLRSEATFLTADQLREAESVFRRLIERPRSLSFYLDYALANYREPDCGKSVPEAVAAYLAVREKDNQRGLLSAPMK
jgi:hypothetical protein